MTAASRIRWALADRFSVDRRALAAFRVALASIVLLDLALRLPDATAFYTDAGVLPRSLLLELYPTLGRLSAHALFGGLWWQLVLFAATVVAALAMAVGYRTRLATAATLLGLVSLQLRNPVLLNAGDSLLRRLLLWSLLLPLGARWSVDARSRGQPTGVDADGPARRVASLAAAGLLVQVLAVYVANAVLKARGDAWHAGTAGRYAFGMDAVTVLLGDWLAGQTLLLTAGTYAWLVVLASAPLLVLATGRRRTGVVAAFAAGHLAMALTLRLGVFPLVSIAALLPFLPSSVWDRLERTVDSRVIGSRFFERTVDRLPATGRGLLPSAVRDRGPGFGRAVAACLLAFVLVWNAAGIGLLALPPAATDTVDPEERRWDMFAPEPRATGGWYVTVGTTDGGERVDAFAGTDSLERPLDVDATYPSHRWYVYLTHLRDSPAPDLRERFGAYLCERWSRQNGGSLARVNVTFVASTVRLDGPDRVDRMPFGETACG
ncbi:HTTM domain-containing protein [Halorubellus sp. JP-L1]|uniref:HTTM domain-containing protein n=1 Tax=Halorubellus sp. JP-L1 TaxID=2715753 RepID=UPI00140AFF8E|nr:HTTM domain-containing protein [Halorubellus sp. JP-L1]NHN40294.1 HTTM domain-containing protein [Halorubellus sp. JP-L1]